LQKKLADDVAKFNDYQLNRWKNVQEKLDSVYVIIKNFIYISVRNEIKGGLNLNLNKIACSKRNRA
jgi:hypothetical protein